MRGVRAFAIATLLLPALIVPAGAAGAGRCGDHPWCDTSLSPDERAGLLLEALTRDEKISLLGGDELFGVTGSADNHIGVSDGVERVDLPPVYYSDGPVGVRQGQATSMPAPIALASTFDRVLARLHGSVVGEEARLKGNDVVFAPTTNIMRTPLGGRTFESYGEDPFLQARMGVEWIAGAQSQGVIGNVKHFAANNQEGLGVAAEGAPLGVGVVGNRLTVDAIVDERTLREIYLPHFEAAVRDAGVGSVMCAYNRLNGQYACENERLLEGILKGDWRFPGFVLADYGAAKDPAGSLRNGLDFDPWPGVVYSPPLVNLALATGGAPESSLDEHVGRILRTLFAFGFFDRDTYPNDDSLIDKEGDARSAGEIEEAGIVLLRNEGVLPLDPARVRSLALIGADADEFKRGGGSSNVTPFFATTPRAGIEARAAEAGVEVRYDAGGDPAQAAEVARGADAAVVVVADAAAEGTDKPCMGISCGSLDGYDRDGLIAAVAAANPRTVVVLETGGPVLTPWREDVAALLEAWYPGVEGGTAIARVLFGDVDPGGRLPATFPRREADQPYAGDLEAYPGVAERVVYKEGVFVGYRWFDEQDVEPAYPFGHGLSYTTFAYRNLRVRRTSNGGATISVQVQNTGERLGSETPQLYLGMPDPGGAVRQPPRVLRGFRRMTIPRGQTRIARFELRPRDFAYWNARADAWRIEPGCYELAVGGSSRDIHLRGVLTQGGVTCAGACTAGAGFRQASARPKGRGVRFAFRRAGSAPVTVTILRHTRGRRVLRRPRVVARFTRRTRPFTWIGRAAPGRGPAPADGLYSVRFSVRGANGVLDTRQVALRRAGGRFRRAPAFVRRTSCGLLRTLRLSGPAFGGSGRRPLRVSFRLAGRARVSVALLRGRRVVRRIKQRGRAGGWLVRVRLSSRGLRPGLYKVRVRAESATARERAVLRSRNL